jgi:sugar phosphate isomerase/epimerase
VKLGCSSWSYHAAFRAGRIDLRQWLRICAEDLDLDGVELVDLHFPTTDPIYLRDIKKLCVDLQLTISGIAISNDFGTEDRRPAEAAKVKQWCDIAAYLGAPVVRVFAGWVPPPSRTEPDAGRIVGMFRRVFGGPKADPRRLWSDVTWTLRDCADYAEERGVVLGLQNNRREGIVGTASQVAQCVRDVGSPWLRVCLDPADIPDRASVDQLLDRVVQVHARLRDIADDGSDASTHWPELLHMLRLGRYRGFLLLDYDVEDPETAVPRAARHMRGLVHQLERQRLLQQPPAAAPAAARAAETEQPAEAAAVRDEVAVLT